MIGGETLLGQVATLMENLHMTYDEVVCKIPYKTLLIMQKDKVQCVDSENIVIKTSGKAFMKRRMAAMNNGN